jgi:hypothetical protein
MPECKIGFSLLRDIVLSVMCGATMGLLVAMIDSSF